MSAILFTILSFLISAYASDESISPTSVVTVHQNEQTTVNLNNFVDEFDVSKFLDVVHLPGLYKQFTLNIGGEASFKGHVWAFYGIVSPLPQIKRTGDILVKRENGTFSASGALYIEDLVLKYKHFYINFIGSYTRGRLTVKIEDTSYDFKTKFDYRNGTCEYTFEELNLNFGDVEVEIDGADGTEALLSHWLRSVLINSVEQITAKLKEILVRHVKYQVKLQDCNQVYQFYQSLFVT